MHTTTRLPLEAALRPDMQPLLAEIHLQTSTQTQWAGCPPGAAAAACMYVYVRKTRCVLLRLDWTTVSLQTHSKNT